MAQMIGLTVRQCAEQLLSMVAMVATIIVPVLLAGAYLRLMMSEFQTCHAFNFSDCRFFRILFGAYRYTFFSVSPFFHWIMHHASCMQPFREYFLSPTLPQTTAVCWDCHRSWDAAPFSETRIGETNEDSINPIPVFVLFCFFNITFNTFQPYLWEVFTLNELLDKPWSLGSTLLPPGTCLYFVAHRVQHSHCSSILIECTW